MDHEYCSSTPLTLDLHTAQHLSLVIRVGLGRHIWAVAQPPNFESLLKGLFMVQLLHTFELLLVKLSILAFYWRIFKVSRYVLGSITVGWVIGQICSPKLLLPRILDAELMQQ